MTINDETPIEASEGRERIAVAAGIALFVAGVTLIGAVLPAEYGIDPLGSGRVLGLTALSDAAQAAAQFTIESADTSGVPIVVPEDRTYQEETVTFTIEPGTFVEYKYRLKQGDVLLYAWTASGLVDVDFHAEPDGAPQGFAESYALDNAVDRGFGTLHAPFSGIHGWYWENLEETPVTVELSASGFYRVAYEFHENADPVTKMFQ